MSRHHARLPSRRWSRVRLEVLERDGWRCRRCGTYGNEADHIVPLAKGGDPWDMANLQCLCGPCHAAKTADEAQGEPTPGAQEWRDFVKELTG